MTKLDADAANATNDLTFTAANNVIFKVRGDYDPPRRRLLRVVLVHQIACLSTILMLLLLGMPTRRWC